MIEVGLAGQAVIGPGLADWNAARDVLRGAAPYVGGPATEPAPGLLPPTERRRASAAVRWALAAAQQAHAGHDAEAVATVFVSCGGDGAITHQICEALASAPSAVSPTRFHNSVHNAPAGYWSIATHSHAASTSLSGFEGSFAIGLLEAATQAVVERCRVLLVAYDLPYPEPMHALWPVAHPFAAALLLDPPGASASAFRLELKPGAARSTWPAAIPAAFQSNPAAWALPLLDARQRGAPARLELPYNDASHLAVEVRP
jgi:hypothetical protein